MNNSLDDIRTFLRANDIYDGEDVFIHGFRLPENVSIEEMSASIFSEGLRKKEKDSILSTIALMPHNKPLEETIFNYIIRGQYRVILKIPEDIEGIFLGKCKEKYGTTGNQYSVNSVLDLLPLSAIPREFIAGIVYTEKEEYDYNEEINFEFLENPYFYDHPDNRAANSEQLAKKLRDALVNSDPTDEILDYLMTGQKCENFDMLIESAKKYKLFDQYEYFLQQREEYYSPPHIDNSELKDFKFNDDFRPY